MGPYCSHLQHEAEVDQEGLNLGARWKSQAWQRIFSTAFTGEDVNLIKRHGKSGKLVDHVLVVNDENLGGQS